MLKYNKGKIYFDSNFNGSLGEEIIEELVIMMKTYECKAIVFEDKFNKSIKNLPDKLESLTLGTNFACTINQYFFIVINHQIMDIK